MAITRDYYDVLGLSRDATDDQIRRAYRTLARELHPDVNTAPDAAERFAELTEAYEVLSDAEKRSRYDRFGAAGVRGGPGAGPGPGGVSFDMDGGDFGSIFEEIMGGGFGRPGRGPFAGGGPAGGAGATRPTRGRDVERTLDVTFRTAALGGVERLVLGGDGTPGQTVEVRIPPAMQPGGRLRLRGKGSPGPGGAPAGDLLITVNVGRHPLFSREGLDLVVDVPLTIAEAALGATVAVPLLQGTADLVVPPGTSSGTRLRLRGKGLVDAAGTSGDLYARARVIAPDPTRLDDAARAHLEALAAVLPNPRREGPWAGVI